MKTILLNNIPFHSIEKDELYNILNENIIGERNSNHIAITNTESMYYANKRPAHKEYLK